MSEYDVRCINCYHKSHENKDCSYCPMPTKENPNSRCREFVRADVFAARALARIENAFANTHGQTMMALSAIFDLLQEAYPDAAAKFKAGLEARQKAAEAEMELQRTKALAEADEALKAATDAEERRKLTELVDSYSNSNVIKFPTKEEDIPEDDPGPGAANG